MDEVARTVWVAGRALRAELLPENVFSAIVGRGLARAHFHQHVFVRPAGVPDEIGWFESLRWSGAPRGDATVLEALSASLRQHFSS